MSAVNVYQTAIALVEGLTPDDTSRGEPSYRLFDGQIEDCTLDRGFTLRMTTQEPVNQISTAQPRWLTEFVCSVRHLPQASLEAEQVRMTQDREQLLTALRDKAQHHDDVEAVLQETIDAVILEDEARTYVTEITYVCHHL